MASRQLKTKRRFIISYYLFNINLLNINLLIEINFLGAVLCRAESDSMMLVGPFPLDQSVIITYFKATYHSPSGLA